MQWYTVIGQRSNAYGAEDNPLKTDALALAYASDDAGNKEAAKSAWKVANTPPEQIQQLLLSTQPLAIPQKQSNNSGSTRYVGDNRVRLRTSPGLTSGVLGSMNSGDPVIFTGNKTEEIDGHLWAEVIYNGKKGWVAADYLKTGEAEAKDTPPYITESPLITSETNTISSFANITDYKDIQKAFNAFKVPNSKVFGDHNADGQLHCADLTKWFIDTYTTLKSVRGDGCKQAERIAAQRNDLYTTNIPCAPAVFSVAAGSPGPGVNGVSDKVAGHTGIVLKVRVVNIPEGSTNPEEYTYEITYLHTYYGIKDSFNSSIATKRYKPSPAVTYVSLNSYMK